MKKIIINGQQTDYEISKDGKVFSNKTNKFLQGSIYNTGIRYNEEKTLKKEYPSLTKAAAAIGLSPSGLYYIIKKGNKYLDDYWMYK